MNINDKKVNLLDLNRHAMRQFFEELGEKPFRADQVMKWLYHYCVDDFEQMTNLNKGLREKLSQVAEILLRKPEAVKVPIDVKYIGFDIPNEFVIGFGLDYAERYRNLPFIGTLAPLIVMSPREGEQSMMTKS